MIREAAGVSSRQLGELLGVDHSAVLRWESGEKRPSDGVVVAYAELLETLACETGLTMGGVGANGGRAA